MNKLKIYSNGAYENDSNDKETKISPFKSLPVTLSWKISALVRLEPTKKTFRNRFDEIKNRVLKKNVPKNDVESQPTIKNILKDVMGIVRPGELCCIMGASGAGKTTLLNCLNFRNLNKLKIDGEVSVNGKQVGLKEITKISGYVQQEDLFIGTLTVYECLRFIAELKMCKNFSQQERLKRVDDVLVELNLAHCKNTLVGNGDRLKGISGGEKRRLSLACEILMNPPLLFCDEPTSGVDSFMAQSIVDSMRYLAKQGRTVISTIHQPSSQIFEKFDVLCLLAEGRIAFMGPLKDAIKFFQKIDYPCPHLYNPADHYIQTLAIVPLKVNESLEKVKKVCDSFERSAYQEVIRKEYAMLIEQSSSITNDIPIDNEINTVKASKLLQIRWLLWRQYLSDVRDPVATKGFIIQSIVTGLLLGLIFLLINRDERGVQNVNGAIFILLMNCNFGYIFNVINSFPNELSIFFRETKNRVYSAFPYYIAKQLSELPKFVVCLSILVSIVYWMAMSKIVADAGVYFIILAIYIVTSQIAIGLGIVLSIAFGDVVGASGATGPILTPLLIFAGFFLNNASVPVYLIWLKYISWFYYANEAMLITIWSNVKSIDCNLPLILRACKNTRCFDNGYEVLSAFNVDERNFGRNIGILLAMLIFFRLLGYAILRYKLNKIK